MRLSNLAGHVHPPPLGCYTEFRVGAVSGFIDTGGASGDRGFVAGFRSQWMRGNEVGCRPESRGRAICRADTPTWLSNLAGRLQGLD